MKHFEAAAGNKEYATECYIALAKEISGIHEVFPFPGIDPEAYLKLKAVENEFPNYATPIDKLLERFKKEGIKVVLMGMNVYVLPAKSDDVENDSIFPKHLQNIESMNEGLKKLILMNRIIA